MGWQKLYPKKQTSAHDAIKRIQSGDRVVVGHACGSPETLLEALVDNKSALKDVEIVHMIPMGTADYCLPENTPYFRHNSLFAG
ncbi:MAG: 4-hydroxybutyrate CoA-transferase, partial [Proteobacteria bacterium]|nr:4-hydroxybutyrate CoA-transferase [Pseudomonadota bacterium]